MRLVFLYNGLAAKEGTALLQTQNRPVTKQHQLSDANPVESCRKVRSWIVSVWHRLSLLRLLFSMPFPHPPQFSRLLVLVLQ